MRAVAFKEIGGPEVLLLVELPTPERPGRIAVYGEAARHPGLLLVELPTPEPGRNTGKAVLRVGADLENVRTVSLGRRIRGPGSQLPWRERP
ncbi:hypothetical protein [Streptomyces sp. cmx-18-6]|uniref:hypothetical protein n=1 Tax=Streptomyces sp. cmx-18-6 TaxID=2790930 RepID=UPI00397ECFF6